MCVYIYIQMCVCVCNIPTGSKELSNVGQEI